MDNIKYNGFDELIERGITFALYRLPYTKNIKLVLQQDHRPQIFNTFSALVGKKGFILAPFQITLDNPIVLISPDLRLDGEEEILNKLPQIIANYNIGKQSQQNNNESINSFSLYEKRFIKFYTEVQNRKFQKLVLSRTLDVLKSDNFSIGQTFRAACDKYPDNFIFLCNTPFSGTWLGCSPEILLAKDENKWKTVALAGTQDTPERVSDICWDEKNKKEQQIVADYMKRQLTSIGIDSVEGNLNTIRSGNLVHLKTEFLFKIEKNSLISAVLQQLHPSPAVCGFPKMEAFDFILQNEGYNRQYYSGFVGYLDEEEQTDLYVNLRCMQMFKDNLRLYAGGGILPSSEVEAEWNETEAKLKTILSILN